MDIQKKAVDVEAWLKCSKCHVLGIEDLSLSGELVSRDVDDPNFLVSAGKQESIVIG